MSLLSMGLTAASAAALPSAIKAMQSSDSGRNLWNSLDRAGQNEVTNYGDAGTVVDWLTGLTRENSAMMQANAREQMDFQRQQNALAMAFNAAEAAKNRNWQELMSNTAHQREVHDLIAAGLNPVLAANSGAPVGSGATAQGVTSSGAAGGVDTSLSGAAASMFGKVIDSLTALKQTEVSAQTAIETEKMRNEVTRYAADISAATGMYASDNALRGTRYSAELGYQGSRYSADSHAAAQRAAAAMSAEAQKYVSDNSYRSSIYASDVQSSTAKSVADIAAAASRDAALIHGNASRDVADINNFGAKERQWNELGFKDYQSTYFPSSYTQLLGSLTGSYADLVGQTKTWQKNFR